MAWYAGKKWNREELVARIGDPHQIAGARGSILTDGKADGVRAIEVTTGSGLSFSVLPGRGMDIPFASHKGKSLGFFSGTGITSPAYFEEPNLEWRRSFYAGMLTTCGIANAGAPSMDRGKPFGLHGRLSNAAAEDLCIDQDWEGGRVRHPLERHDARGGSDGGKPRPHPEDRGPAGSGGFPHP
jgi:hypothetical protein